MNRAKKILGLFEEEMKDIYGEPVEDEEHYFLKKKDSDLYAGRGPGGKMTNDMRSGARIFTGVELKNMAHGWQGKFDAEPLKATGPQFQHSRGPALGQGFPTQSPLPTKMGK